MSSINSVELGKRLGSGLTAATCLRLAHALGVTIAELLSMDEDESECLAAVAS
jgi:hypothetical protein